MREGRFAECKPIMLQLAARFPVDVPVMRLAVQCLGALGEHHAALYHARRLLATNPRDGGLQLNVARLHARLGEIDAAVAAFNAAIAAGLLDAIPELAQLRLGSGRISEGLRALDEHERLLAVAAIDDGARHAILARLQLVKAQFHFAQGDVDRCVQTCEGVHMAEPDVAASLQAVKASCMNYMPGVSRERVFAEHRRFGELLENSIPATPRDWRDRLRPDRRPLRVGVISPDMRTHSVAVFALPLLRQLHARPADFHVTVFHVGGVEDSMTKLLRQYTHAWQHMPHESAEQIARAVMHANIDIAIELAGLTDTLGVCALAHRPAPVAITAIGYPNSCGTARIHARVVDSATDPGDADRDAVESLVRLDPCFLCYSPPIEASTVPPRDPSRPIRFGSFNAAHKLNRDIAQTWARVLEAVPTSTLLLKASGVQESAALEDTCERLATWGLPMQRVRVVPATRSRAEHLAMYGQVDIALDTFPYHGTTTTCEALYMGTPVITLAGDRHVSRVGVSLLRAVGLTDFIATSPQDYVRIAADLAADRSRVAELHASLRDRLLASVLCDEQAYGERFAAMLRTLWLRECENIATSAG